MPVTAKSFVNRTNDDCFGIALDLDCASQERAQISGIASNCFRNLEYFNDEGPGADKSFCAWQWPEAATPLNPQDEDRHYSNLWISHAASAQITVTHARALRIKSCEWLGDRLKKKQALIQDVELELTRESDVDGKKRFKWTVSNPHAGPMVVTDLAFKCYEHAGGNEYPEDPGEVAQKLALPTPTIPGGLMATDDISVVTGAGATWDGTRGTLPNNGSIAFTRAYGRDPSSALTFAVISGQLSPGVGTDCYFASVWRIFP